MHNRHVAFVALALAVLASATTPGVGGAQDTRIGYINSAEILARAPGSAEAQGLFEEEMRESENELQRMEQDLQNRAEDLQRQALTLSPEARAAREQQLALLQQEYNSRFQELETSATQRRAELVQPIMDRVTQVIEAIREEGGYALILDTVAGSIISADPELDLTQAVLDQLEAMEAEAGDAEDDGSLGSDGASTGGSL